MKTAKHMKTTLMPVLVATMLLAIVIPACVMTACSGMSLFGHVIPGMGPSVVFKSVCGMVGDPSAPDAVVVTSLLTFLAGLVALVAGRHLFGPTLVPVRSVRPVAESPPRPPDDFDTERLRL